MPETLETNSAEVSRIMAQWEAMDHRDRDPVRRERRSRLLRHIMRSVLEFILMEGALAWEDAEIALIQARGALRDCDITCVSSVPGAFRPDETD